MSVEEEKSNNPLFKIEINEDDNIYYENGLENDQDGDETEEEFNEGEGCVEDGES